MHEMNGKQVAVGTAFAAGVVLLVLLAAFPIRGGVRPVSVPPGGGGPSLVLQSGLLDRLLDGGLGVDSRVPVRMGYTTPLQVARRLGDAYSVRLLLQAGARERR